MKKIFNYFARDVKRSWSFRHLECVLGTENTTYSGGDFTSAFESFFNPVQARAAIMADRAVTLTGVFATVAAFAMSPALIAVPAIVGLGVASRVAGYAAAYGIDASMKKISKKLKP